MFLPSEQSQVLSFIDKFATRKSGVPRVLDVGSGKGRYLDLFREKGWSTTGVEVNPRMVEEGRSRGHSVFLPDQEAFRKLRFDAILLSHVVEHFDPAGLLRFLEQYLSLLEAGGVLVVATPLLHPGFFDDFDHVKPYQPVGFQMLLAEENAQLQFQWKGRMRLEELWYRRSPLRITHCRARLLPGPARYLLRLSDLVFSTLFSLTFGFLGRSTGWVGVFRKLG